MISRKHFLSGMAGTGLLAQTRSGERPVDLRNLFDVIDTVAPKSPAYPGSFLAARIPYARWRRAASDRVLDLLQYRPAAVPPAAVTIETVDAGDHVRERIEFSTGPGMRVPAFVLVPKRRQGRGPAIVDLHSHGGMYLFGKEKVVDLGANHSAMTPYHAENYEGRPTATELVKRGYVVISIDAFGFGERRYVAPNDPGDRSGLSVEQVRELNRGCGAKESTIAKAMVMAGLTWPGILFWDDSRTVDYLAARPEVDPSRIGCVGVSMGGYRSLYLGALDERIKACCVAGFLSTVRPMVRSHLDTHSWVHFLPGLHREMDLPDVASLAAPRHLMVLQCSRDGLFPLAGMQAAVDRIDAVYRKAGLPTRFTGRFYDVPHRFSRQMQDDTFDWFSRVL